MDPLGGNRSPYVFLSYASADRERALQIADLLEARGVSVWIDRKSIAGGTSWSAEIVRGIEECMALVVLCSTAAMASPNVQQELQLAWEHRKAILPLLLDKTPLPRSVEYVLAGRQWVEVLDRAEDVWLTQALRALASQGIAVRSQSPTASDSSGSAWASPLPVTPGLATPLHHNLPSQVTSFIGREKELAEVRHLLQSIRLLTLTGSGGCGKTRLALQVASDLLGEYPDGVWFVELAPLTDESLVPQAVLTALGLRAVPSQPISVTLSDYLRDRQVLLVIDNCEHLIGASAQLVATLLRVCPKLRILATSRELLGVAGEVPWSVPSLALPDPSQLTAVDVVKDVEAVRLFVDRAAAVQRDLVVTPQNAAAIAQICLRLDGIPLAIELAAARMRGLTVEQIAARLDDRFRLLTGGSRTSLRRQQTLRAAVDWSYDLLSEAEQMAFRRLSVFAGGWTLEAAESVCAGDRLDAGDVMDLMLQLVDKSLVLVDEQRRKGRYRFLEMIRQYAGEKLLDAGEAAAVRKRHRDSYLILAEQAEPHLQGGEQREWLDRLEVEHDNLRAALDWSHGQLDDASLELRLAAALGRFWHWRGFTAEGLGRLRAALDRTEDETSPARALAMNWAGRLEVSLGNLVKATELLNASVALSRQLQDPWLVCFALRHLAMVGNVPSPNDRHALYAESLRYGRQAGAKHDVAWALVSEVGLFSQEGDKKTAERMYREALAIGREARDRTSTSQCLNGLGWLAREDGDYPRSEAFHQEALVVASEIDYLNGMMEALAFLGWLARDQGELAVARTYLRRALAEARRAGDVQRATAYLVLYASVRVAENAWESAARMLSAAVILRKEGSMNFFIGADYRTSMDAARRHLTSEEFATAWDEGQSMTLERAIGSVLAETSA
jgi:predicted ATPase